jgi:hypothetical protein
VQTSHMSDIYLSILLDVVVGVYGYEASGFGESVNDHPNRVKLVGRNKLRCGVSFDIHDSTKQMKDKHSKSLAKPQGQGSMITKTQGAHLVGMRDTPVILSHNERARDEHGNTCVH